MEATNNKTNGEDKMFKTTTDDNNSKSSVGIFPNNDGTFLVMTLCQSKTYKTLNGAIKCAKKWNVYFG